MEILFSLELQKQTLTSFNASKTGLSVLSVDVIMFLSLYLAKLHLLSVKEHINFKLLTIIYQGGMDNLQPICSMTFNFIRL